MVRSINLVCEGYIDSRISHASQSQDPTDFSLFAVVVVHNSCCINNWLKVLLSTKHNLKFKPLFLRLLLIEFCVLGKKHVAN